MSQTQPQPPIPADRLRDLYGIRATAGSWQFLGNAGGFSGAVFWRLRDPQLGCLALRLWPAGTDIERVRWIHAALRHVSSQGVSFVPVPVVHRLCATVFQVEGRLAELVPWLEGTADFCQRPTVARLRHAMCALAQLHLALASFEPHPPAAAPGILLRRERWRALNRCELQQLLQAPAATSNRELIRFVTPLVESVARSKMKLSARLDEVAARVVPLQVCLRDIWHDHLLFVDDQVTGIVDFDALRADSVCLDLVRLLQSLVGNDDAGWQTALATYQAWRPLGRIEQSLLPVLRQLNPILSVASWLHWGLVEGRQFDSMETVVSRLEAWRRLLP